MGLKKPCHPVKAGTRFARRLLASGIHPRTRVPFKGQAIPEAQWQYPGSLATLALSGPDYRRVVRPRGTAAAAKHRARTEACTQPATKRREVAGKKRRRGAEAELLQSTGVTPHTNGAGSTFRAAPVGRTPWVQAVSGRPPPGEHPGCDPACSPSLNPRLEALRERIRLRATAASGGV